MVEREFCSRIRDGQWADLEDHDAIDLFPPTSCGMRLRIFQLDDLLERRTRQARELLELWGMIQWGKLSVNLSWMIQNTDKLTRRRQTWQSKYTPTVHQISQQVSGVSQRRMGNEWLLDCCAFMNWCRNPFRWGHICQIYGCCLGRRPKWVFFFVCTCSNLADIRWNMGFCLKIWGELCGTGRFLGWEN